AAAYAGGGAHSHSGPAGAVRFSAHRSISPQLQATGVVIEADASWSIDRPCARDRAYHDASCVSPHGPARKGIALADDFASRLIACAMAAFTMAITLNMFLIG